MRNPSNGRPHPMWLSPAELVLVFAIVATVWPAESWSRGPRRGSSPQPSTTTPANNSEDSSTTSSPSQPTVVVPTGSPAQTGPTPAAAPANSANANSPPASTSPAQKSQPKSILMQQSAMPGKSFSGPLPALTERETAVRDGLKKDIEQIAGHIGERNTARHDKLTDAARYIEKGLADSNYQVSRQTYDAKGQQCFNIEAETKGTTRADEIIVVGAHYDTVRGSAGANDNGSGVAALLALARGISGKSAERTVRFVAFANEEQPFFQTDAMGSLVYARRCKQRNENVIGMISLETIGYFADEPKTQRYPQASMGQIYPTTGNFIAIIGNIESAPLVKWTTGCFREKATIPSEGAALPSRMDGVGWSDQWAFWQAGYPALMITDTAIFRYPYYHKAEDTPDKLDFDRMARVVAGLEHVVSELSNTKVSTARKQ